MSISALERAEHELVDALWRLPLGKATDSIRASVQSTLDRVRARKTATLRNNPDVLRKSSNDGAMRRVSSPLVNSAEVDQIVKEARDRAAGRRRLAEAAAKLPNRVRYKPPEHLRGTTMQLIDGRRLDIPKHGFCELAGPGPHSGSGPHMQSAVHRQLLNAGFRPMPDNPDYAAAMSLKSALARPIVGDLALISFLNRRARPGS